MTDQIAYSNSSSKRVVDLSLKDAIHYGCLSIDGREKVFVLVRTYYTLHPLPYPPLPRCHTIDIMIHCTICKIPLSSHIEMIEVIADR